MRKRPLYEVVGQLGMWGVIVNGVQASIIEHHKMKEVTWSGRNSPSRSFPVEFEICVLTPFLKLVSYSVILPVRKSWFWVFSTR